MELIYADASALVKLVLSEDESGALHTYLGDAELVSSELVLTEVPRAVHRASASDRSLERDSLWRRASELIDAVALWPLDQGLLLGAGALAEPALRSLDAIHVVTAVSVDPDLFVSYDERQAKVARLVGLRVAAPGA